MKTMHKLELAACNHFGLTNDYHTAGYLLTDGSMLDFSGAHWLDKDFYSKAEIREWKSKNQLRQVDHEDIAEIMEDFKGADKIADHRKYFMQLGAIRLSPEAPGFNILKGIEPTKEQYKALKNFILDVQNDKNFAPDKCFVDIEEKYPDKIFYPIRINPDRIIQDLQKYYKTGEKPQSDFLWTVCA